MRTGIKNAIRAIAFILILAICLLGVNHVLTPKRILSIRWNRIPWMCFVFWYLYGLLYLQSCGTVE